MVTEPASPLSPRWVRWLARWLRVSQSDAARIWVASAPFHAQPHCLHSENSDEVCCQCGQRFPDITSAWESRCADSQSTENAVSCPGCGTTENLLRGWCAGCVQVSQNAPSPTRSDARE